MHAVDWTNFFPDFYIDGCTNAIVSLLTPFCQLLVEDSVRKGAHSHGSKTAVVKVSGALLEPGLFRRCG